MLAADDDGVVEAPPVPVEVVNGLGAGDAFGGALCHGLLAGWDAGRIIGSRTPRARSSPPGSPARRRCPPTGEVEALLSGAPVREGMGDAVSGTFAERLAGLTEIRANHPEAVAEAAARRGRRSAPLGPSGRLMIVAADHPARGALAAGDRPLAMADRAELLRPRCAWRSTRPGVDGVLGTPDVIEDLLLLGVLDDKVVIGSMNRGGLAGAAFEIDDRFTAYDPAAIAGQGLDGGKMLLRIDDEDPATARTLEACANAVTGLARQPADGDGRAVRLPARPAAGCATSSPRTP